jgi:hypothetical protein
MTRRQLLGAALLIAAAIVLIAYLVLRDDDPEPTPNPGDPTPTQEPAPTEVPEQITVVGYGGRVKAEFFENQEVIDILRNRYGITVDITGMGTLELLCEAPLDGIDFLWAGDQSQIPIYEECRSRSDTYQNPVLISPLVIYSWTDTTNALIEAGVVEVGDDGVYRIDMLRLMALIDSDRSWADLGFENRTGKVLVKSTDPNASTSGQMFAALMANTMNCMEVVNGSSVGATLPGIHTYFEKLGLMPEASAELFRLYLSLGEGSYPLVALLESQIIEAAVENPDSVAQLEDEIRILYPEPTVWLTNPMIELTDAGGLLAQAMLDPDIQRLGWPKQGFRPSVPGVQIDLSVLPIPGIQEDITSVIDTPANAVMDQILNAVLPEYIPDPNAPPRPVCESSGTVPASPVAVRDD